MGDLISFLDYKQKKQTHFGSYTEWVTYRFLRGPARTPTSRYDVAVEEQQQGMYYLYKYFFPDFDW